MISLLPHICEQIENNTAFVLTAILSHQGSTPRTSGSRMLVRQDASIAGTIGGGLVEAKVIDACTKLLGTNQSQVMEFNLDQEAKQGIDMICGGSLTVWIRSFAPDFSTHMIQAYKEMQRLGKKGGKAVLVTAVTSTVPADPVLIKPVDLMDETLCRGLNLPGPLLADIQDEKFKGNRIFQQEYANKTYMIEPLVPRETLYIFGAGHVGFALAQMAHMVDFSLVIIDDRKTFANKERFPLARQVKVVGDFSKAFEDLASDHLTIDDCAYIVILTRGHLHDQIVLAQALKTPAAYIGMIGSRKKTARIYENLIQTGVAPEALEQVHAPIGVSIAAETPEEIAVSILGELIKERAQNKGRAVIK